MIQGNIYINLREYIQDIKKLNFCEMEFFTFDRTDETINICKKKKECQQSVEDFIIQSLLTQCCENDYMKEEIISVKDNRLTDLHKFIFSTSTGGKEIYVLNLIENEKGYQLLSKWLSKKNLIELNLNLHQIKKLYILNELDSMHQELIFYDNMYLYYLSRGLG
jgi:hypothetical protein